MIRPSDCVLDRTGFPYLPLPEGKTAVGVLPVTKAQAEVWLGDPNGPGDEWYAEVLGVSPRVGWRVPGSIAIRQLFLSGITTAEVERMAHWFGEGIRLPTLAEWREADRLAAPLSVEWYRELLDDLAHRDTHPAAVGVLRRLLESRKSGRAIALFQDGFLDWVTRPGGPAGGLGRPPASLAGTMILDPQSFDPVVSLRSGRNPLFAARLVLPLGGGS